MSCVGGRASRVSLEAMPLRLRASKNMRSPVGSNQLCLHWFTLAEDLVRLPQLAVLAFEGLILLGHLAGDTGPLAAVDHDLIDPVIQGLRRAADLRRDRQNGLPMRSMLALIVQNQTNCAFAHFGGKLVRGLARDAASHSEFGAAGKPGAIHNALKSNGGLRDGLSGGLRSSPP